MKALASIMGAVGFLVLMFVINKSGPELRNMELTQETSKVVRLSALYLGEVLLSCWLGATYLFTTRKD